MTRKNKLFLHVGPGKTGSSAIQRWLLDNASSLYADGYYYPVPPSLAMFEGNAREMVHWLRDVPVEDPVVYTAGLSLVLKGYHDDMLAKGCSSLILSEEQLAAARPLNLKILKSVAAQFFDLYIVLVARHPYAWLWSSWGQCVKRHGDCREFSVFARGNVGFYNISYERYLDEFDDIILIGYTVRGLVRDFAQAVGIDPARHGGEGIGSEQVNRSLTRDELDIILCINRALVQPEIGRFLSDYMVSQRPTTLAHFEMHSVILEMTEARCGSVMRRLEDRLPNCVRLSQSDAHAGIGDEKGTVIPLDVLEHLVRVVQSETEKRIRAECIMSEPKETSRRQWPSIVRKPYKWSKKKLSTLQATLGRRK